VRIASKDEHYITKINNHVCVDRGWLQLLACAQGVGMGGRDDALVMCRGLRLSLPRVAWVQPQACLLVRTGEWTGRGA